MAIMSHFHLFPNKNLSWYGNCFEKNLTNSKYNVNLSSVRNSMANVEVRRERECFLTEDMPDGCHELQMMPCSSSGSGFLVLSERRRVRFPHKVCSHVVCGRGQMGESSRFQRENSGFNSRRP